MFTCASIAVLIIALFISTLSFSISQQPAKTAKRTIRKTMPSRNEAPIELPNSKAPGLLADMDSDLAVILTHPWGPLGGNMHNNVVAAASLYFQKLGITTLRFDFVGWQLSWGNYQAHQVEEAAQFLLTDDDQNERQTRRPTKILLVGYSYGSLLAASASANISQAVGVVSIAPPWSVKHWLLLFNSGHHLRQASQSRQQDDQEELPRLFLIGDHDNFTSEQVFTKTVETHFPKDSTTAVVLKDVDHFFHRREKDVVNSIGEWLLKTFPKCQGDLKKLSSSEVYS